MAIDEEFIRNAARDGSYELSLHADEERLNDHLTVVELEEVLASCEIIERCPDDPRGESCLMLGFCGGSRFMLSVARRNKEKYS